MARGRVLSAIALAKAAGARHVVVRLGRIAANRARERDHEVRSALLADGPTEEVRRGADRIRREAERLAEPYLERACRELFELQRAEPEVRLAVATPSGLFGFPTFGTLSLLLGELRGDGFGYWHDAGPARLFEALGLAAPGAWAGDHAERILGTSLHDVVGTEMHLPPGCGEVDFRVLRESIPSGVPAVVDVEGRFPLEELRLATSLLSSIGY